MSEDKIKVVIADDSPEFIEGIIIMLSTSDRYEVIDILHNGKDLLNSELLAYCDIVLTDIEMPEINGIEAAKRINYLYPKLPIIAITMYIDKVYLDEIIGAGFKGFIYKPKIFEQLFETIDTVLDNNFSFNTTDLKIKEE